MSDSSSSDTGSDGGFDDWEEDEDQNVKCLFCELRVPQPAVCMEHMVTQHNFNLVEIKRSLGNFLFLTSQ